MSKIKNNEITHTGNSGTSNIVLGSAGQVTTQGVLTPTGGLSDNCIDGANIALGSDAAGDIMYYNGTDYIRLGKGSTGHYLKQGGSNAPEWAAITSVDTNALAKAWITFSGDTSNTTRDHYNIASVTDNGAGDYTFTFDTDFANINYCGACTQSFQWQRNSNLTGSGFASLLAFRYRAVGSCRVQNVQASGGSHMDIDDLNIVWFGDQ